MHLGVNNMVTLPSRRLPPPHIPSRLLPPPNIALEPAFIDENVIIEDYSPFPEQLNIDSR